MFLSENLQVCLHEMAIPASQLTVVAGGNLVISVT